MNAHRYRLATTLLWVLGLPWLLFPAAVPFLPALVLGLLLAARLSARRWYGDRLRATFLDGLWLVYLALTLLAYAVSPLPERSLPKLTVTLAGLFGYYLAQDWLHTVGDLRRLAWLLARAGMALAFLALFVVAWPAGGAQLLNLDPLYQRLPAWGQVHRNEMAGMLLLLLPFVCAAVQRSTPGRARWPAAAGVLLVLAVLLLTQSRVAVVALAVMVLLAVGWHRLTGRLLVVAGMLALSVILLLALWPAGSPDSVTAAVARLDGSTKSGPAVSWLARLDLWQAAGQLLGDYPVLGAGLDTFYPVARSNYVLDNLDLDQDLNHAHNLFLQGGASMGWPGLLLLLLLWAAVLTGLYRVSQAAPTGEVAGWARLWSVSVAGFLAFNLVDVITLGHRPALLLWLVLAGVAALVRLSDQPFHVPRSVVLAAPALLLLLALPFLSRNLANLHLDRYVLRGDGALPAVEAFTGDVRRQGLVAFYGSADGLALAYWQQDPQGAQFVQDRGFVAHRAGALEDAQRLYTLALALDGDNARTLYWRGLAAAGLADLPAAASDLEQATRLAGAEADPKWLALLHYHWGRVLAEQGDLLAAHPHLQRAVSLDETQPRYADLLNEVVGGLELPAGGERTP